MNFLKEETIYLEKFIKRCKNLKVFHCSGNPNLNISAISKCLDITKLEIVKWSAVEE